MSYGLASAVSLRFDCADRRARYRPSRRPGPARSAGKSDRSAVSSGPSERYAQQRDGGARWRRIKLLSKKLSESLSGDARMVWLELEEALHAHWLDVASDQYQRGHAAGSAQELLLLRTTDRATPEARLQAMVVMLSAIADELEGE